MKGISRGIDDVGEYVIVTFKERYTDEQSVSEYDDLLTHIIVPSIEQNIRVFFMVDDFFSDKETYERHMTRLLAHLITSTTYTSKTKGGNKLLWVPSKIKFLNKTSSKEQNMQPEEMVGIVKTSHEGGEGYTVFIRERYGEAHFNSFTSMTDLVDRVIIPIVESEKKVFLDYDDLTTKTPHTHDYFIQLADRLFRSAALSVEKIKKFVVLQHNEGTMNFSVGPAPQLTIDMKASKETETNEEKVVLVSDSRMKNLLWMVDRGIEVVSPNLTTIDIGSALGSKYPAGRYKKDGPATGEHLRDDHIIPALEKGGYVVVSMQSADAGCGSSFIEEAFGGLIRKGYSLKDLEDRLLVFDTRKTATSALESVKGFIHDAHDIKVQCEAQHGEDVPESPEVCMLYVNKIMDYKFTVPYTGYKDYLVQVYIKPALERGSHVILNFDQVDGVKVDMVSYFTSIVEKLVMADVPKEVILAKVHAAPVGTLKGYMDRLIKERCEVKRRILAGTP